MLIIAAVLTALIGIGHSYRGEQKFVTSLLERDDLPIVFGSIELTRRTIRIAWHLSSVMLWGFAVILGMLQFADADIKLPILLVICAVTVADTQRRHHARLHVRKVSRELVSDQLAH